MDTHELAQTVPGFVALDHVAIAVHNLDAATRTYGTVLGFRVLAREALPARGIEVAFVELGNTHVELVAPTRNDSEVSGFLAKRGEGLHHICVQVRGIAQVLHDMQQRGAQLIDAVPRPGARGAQVAFVHPKGAHGVLLELAEPATPHS